ncbi:hypothetical protein [Arsenicicoccus dermatophilus]|uniref:hypothetical protein n=1 Tax=Arsenicicoccus dermatophilus TaxID=1076331 RepID=UPI00391753C8
MPTRSDTWPTRDLRVLRAVELLDLVQDGPHPDDLIAVRAGLPVDDVDAALLVLERVRAVHLAGAPGSDLRVTHLTAIGATMLTMEAETGLAS